MSRNSTMPHYDDFGGKLSGSDRVMTSAKCT